VGEKRLLFQLHQSACNCYTKRSVIRL
jgi:hypothetical protein